MDVIVDVMNQRTMRSAAAVSIYSRSEGLSPPERVSLERVADRARGKAILDIGVGGGRTVAELRKISADYLGIDSSHAMITACRRRFPDARFDLADARALTSIEDGSIFLAVFSCNGIGMVNHADRLAIMREVYRILMPGGCLSFPPTTRIRRTIAPASNFPPSSHHATWRVCWCAPRDSIFTP